MKRMKSASESDARSVALMTCLEERGAREKP